MKSDTFVWLLLALTQIQNCADKIEFNARLEKVEAAQVHSR